MSRVKINFPLSGIVTTAEVATKIASQISDLRQNKKEC